MYLESSGNHNTAHIKNYIDQIVKVSNKQLTYNQIFEFILELIPLNIERLLQAYPNETVLNAIWKEGYIPIMGLYTQVLYLIIFKFKMLKNTIFKNIAKYPSKSTR